MLNTKDWTTNTLKHFCALFAVHKGQKYTALPIIVFYNLPLGL